MASHVAVPTSQLKGMRTQSATLYFSFWRGSSKTWQSVVLITEGTHSFQELTPNLLGVRFHWSHIPYPFRGREAAAQHSTPDLWSPSDRRRDPNAARIKAITDDSDLDAVVATERHLL